MDASLRILLGAQIAELESQIERLLATDEALAETVRIIRSVPGIGPVASTMLIAEMPELGQISGAQAAAGGTCCSRRLWSRAITTQR
jgi:transposase